MTRGIVFLSLLIAAHSHRHRSLEVGFRHNRENLYGHDRITPLAVDSCDPRPSPVPMALPSVSDITLNLDNDSTSDEEGEDRLRFDVGKLVPTEIPEKSCVGDDMTSKGSRVTRVGAIQANGAGGSPEHLVNTWANAADALGLSIAVVGETRQKPSRASFSSGATTRYPTMLTQMTVPISRKAPRQRVLS